MTALPLPARHALAPATPAATAASPVVSARSVGWGRLFLIEARKLVDTRAARWLLAGTFAVPVLAVGLLAFLPRKDTSTLTIDAENLLTTGIGSLTLLLPVMAILLAAGEWTQRSALVTFTLEPRRVRVLAAKLAAVVAATLALTVAVGVLSLGVVAAAGAIGHHQVAWTMNPAHLFWAVAATLLAALQGFAFGALLMNTPAAIVAYFLFPAAIRLVELSGGPVAEAMTWLDMDRNFALLVNDGFGQANPAKAAVSVGFCVLLPLVAGAIRLVRREVN